MREQKGETKMAQGKRFYAWLAPKGDTPMRPIAYGETFESALKGISMFMLGLHGEGTVATIVEYDMAEGV